MLGIFVCFAASFAQISVGVWLPDVTIGTSLPTSPEPVREKGRNEVGIVRINSSRSGFRKLVIFTTGDTI
jgi:hypothetical protein